MKKYNRKSHPLKTEIYKHGFTIESFANECCISRWTLNSIFTRNKHKTRGDTIKIISDHIGIPYESVEVMCNASV